MRDDQPSAHPRWGMAATGVGSLPGTDVVEAVKLVLGELTDLPHLPELPARGPGADMIGRTGGLLVELPVEIYAGRWRVASRPGRDLRRARDLLERDLDALTEAAEGYVGPLKIQATGPWTLAANVDLVLGGRMLRDHGAVRDLTDSLAEGLRAHVADVARRVPGARLLLQLDEPSLPMVLAGQVPTESGLWTLPAVEESRAEDALRTVIDAAGAPVIVHCCAPQVPVELIARAGAAGVSLDLEHVRDASDMDRLGELIDAGRSLFAGAVTPRTLASPSADGRPSASAVVADRVWSLWRQLGFSAERLTQVVVTPTCGLANATPQDARSALATCVEAAKRLAERGD